MPDIRKVPIQTELASLEKSAALSAETYMGLLTNPDTILTQRGAGNYDIYTETLRDDQVKSTFQQRRLAVVSAEWMVDPGLEGNRAARKAADALREQLTAIRFDEITDQMLFGLFYGNAVGEIMWRIDGGMVNIDEIKVRDRARFRYGLDGGIYLQRKDWQFDRMPERKFWTFRTGDNHGDNPYGIGLAHYLYWPVYFKRADIKFWLVFLEKFGAPTPVGKLPAGQAANVETRKKLLQALKSFSTDAAIVIPEGAEVSLLEATRSGAASYDEMRAAMDAAISKVVLSQTMTTDNGSSRSQAEVHGGVRDMVVKADADMICESFMRQVVAWWMDYNFPGVAMPRVWRNTSPPEDLFKRAERDEKIMALGYEPTEEYIKETYGEGWTKKQAPAIPPMGAPNPFSALDPNATPDDQTPQEFAEANLVAALKAGHRADQFSLISAAQQFAGQYETMLGRRVQQLLDYAEATEDFETFRKRLAEMMAETPDADAVEKVRRANVFSRVLGALRTQR